MTIFDFNELTQLNVNADEYSRIEKVNRLLGNEDDKFAGLWQTLGEEHREMLINAAEKVEDESAARRDLIVYLADQKYKLVAQLAKEYARHGEEDTIKVGIDIVGSAVFYTAVIEGSELFRRQEDRDAVCKMLK